MQLWLPTRKCQAPEMKHVFTLRFSNFEASSSNDEATCFLDVVEEFRLFESPMKYQRC